MYFQGLLTPHVLNVLLHSMSLFGITLLALVLWVRERKAMLLRQKLQENFYQLHRRIILLEERDIRRREVKANPQPPGYKTSLGGGAQDVSVQTPVREREVVPPKPPMDTESYGREFQFAGGSNPHRVSRPSIQSTVYYAAAPEADGSFKVNQLSTEASYKMLYRLTTQAGATVAALSLWPQSEQFATAIASPQRYLDPACKYAQPPGPGSSTIVETAQGQAMLEDERWIILSEIKIEFR